MTFHRQTRVQAFQLEKLTTKIHLGYKTSVSFLKTHLV